LREPIEEVARRAAAWRSGYAEPTIATVRSDPEAARSPAVVEAGKKRFDAFRAAVNDLRRVLDPAREAARDELDRNAVIVRFWVLGTGIVILLTVFAVALVLRGTLVRPLRALAGTAREVAQGDFEREVRGSGAREVVDLGQDVDAMRARIVDELEALRVAETELKRSNAELEQFAYVASHDLQEPLRKVASFTQMLQRRYGGELDERADRYIEFAVDGARRMQELINDLLEFSRVGRMTREHELIPAQELVDSATARLATLIEDAGAQVTVHGELPAVSGDRGLLSIVFQNLIGNGIKFRGEDPPRIDIAAERDGRAWRFTVTDNGIGVDDEYAERIFVIFQRLHTRDAYEGTGIGLAMCRKIIEYHGGRIALAPSEAGRGARFAFTLPVVEPEEGEPAA